MARGRNTWARLAALLIIATCVLLGSVSAASALPCDPSNPSCQPPPPPPVSWQLHVVVQGDGVVKRGTTTVCGANSTCDVSYVDGTSLALTATPNSGYTFLVWGGDCSGISTCNLTMDQDHSVTASFADVTPPGPPQIVSPASSDPPIQSTTGGSTNVAFNNGGDASTASFLCRVDIANAGLAQPCSSPWNTGNLSTGTHTVWLWAKDAAGNISSPASRSFKVVNLPDTTIGGTPIEGATTDSSTAFTYASPTGTSFACTLDGGAVPCSANVGPLPDGPHAWTVAAGISPFGDNVVYYDPSPAIRNFTVATASPGGGGGSGDAGAAGGPGGAGGTAGTGDTGGSVGTAGPGDSGGAGGAAGGGSTTTNPPAIAAKLARAFKTSKAGVTVTRLQLSGVTSGAALSITCKGKGCGFKSKKVTLKKGAAALQALFKKRTLKPGAVITVKLARAGMRGKLFTLTVKKHGQPALKIASV